MEHHLWKVTYNYFSDNSIEHVFSPFSPIFECL